MPIAVEMIQVYNCIMACPSICEMEENSLPINDMLPPLAYCDHKADPVGGITAF